MTNENAPTPTRERLTFRRRVLDVFTAYGIAYAWVTFVSFAGRHLILDSHIDLDGQIKWGMVYLGVLKAPFVEELMYRAVPLGIALHHPRLRPYVQVVAVMTTIAFALAHYPPYPLMTIFPIQGAMGFIAAQLFIAHARRGPYWAAYLACICMHGIYNFTALTAY